VTWYLREPWHGQFKRSETLTLVVDPGRAHATFGHGGVRITLPKAAQARPSTIASHAGGAKAIGAGEQQRQS
jgi:HSP20 family molecular chaperone IbpA